MSRGTLPRQRGGLGCPLCAGRLGRWDWEQWAGTGSGGELHLSALCPLGLTLNLIMFLELPGHAAGVSLQIGTWLCPRRAAGLFLEEPPEVCTALAAGCCRRAGDLQKGINTMQALLLASTRF